MDTNETIISLNHTSVYQKNILILSNVNLSISKGEFVYLIGETGSGKSSLLKILYADLPLFEGEGVIAGFNLKEIKNKDIPFLRRKIGIVFQDFQLLIDRDVNENLLFVLKATGWTDTEKMQSKIQEVLNKVGLVAKGHKMPHQLSGGEQQRVVIARALLNDPEIILADEPTGNLDPKTSEDILSLLIEISKAGKAVLMATHDYSLFNKFQSRTLKCENGSVLETHTSHQGNNISTN
ncbi:MAG TPA: ATP-binding cassette domain-containing protein [Bacteroidales bacterium]|nr:ATP-binding cassette domain-containing protein [Bacteroidales bacterium]HPS17580.1 ATP-binding cassette domain-containing protein [Bacteroidales bacterium]